MEVMDRCHEIVANVKMEECYAGLSLVYVNDPKIREEIETAVKKIKSETGMSPKCFDNSKDKTEEKLSLYIEFNDDAQRDSGDFFQKLLSELKIDKCRYDVIEG